MTLDAGHNDNTEETGAVKLSASAAFKTLEARYPPGSTGAFDRLQQGFHKFIAGTSLPAHWLYPIKKTTKQETPDPQHDLTQKAGLANRACSETIKLEIVSHCWNYSHFLAFQLGSLIANPPPDNLPVTVTIFYSPEDCGTLKLLQRIDSINVANVTWNWQSLPAPYLFRRSIGRNLAARNTSADWVWFTDCDETFQKGCLESLHKALQQTEATLVYPALEHRTAPLENSVFEIDYSSQSWLETICQLPLEQFHVSKMSRATGPLQISRGNVVRELGYCDSVSCFQKPETQFAKAHEDRVFRWLLGSQGTAMDIDGVYRIQHRVKGRHENSSVSRIREKLRHARYRRAQS